MAIWQKWNIWAGLSIAVFTIIHFLYITSNVTSIKYFIENMFVDIMCFNCNTSSIDSNTFQPYAISTPGCKIQDFDPFDITIKDIIPASKVIQCTYPPPLVRKLGLNILSVDSNILQTFYKGNLDYCMYWPIFRDGNGKTDNAFKFGEQIEFYKNATIKDDFIMVECYYSNTSIYQDFYPFIVKKSSVEKRSAVRLTKKQSSENLSVMILGVDSVSRLNFQRYCPKTYKYLKNVMKAIELKGYNKVGDNTFVNLVPLLMGKYASELPWNSSQSFDHLNIIWKDYATNGYRTLFAEDSPQISLFNYEMLGFFHEPTDYYLRPFYQAYMTSQMLAKSRYQCAGDRFHSDLILNWLHDYMKLFYGHLSFSFTFLTSLTHDKMENLYNSDQIFESFFKTVMKDNLLNNTILFFISDHGMRFGKFRNSYVGRLEERLPMAFLVLPPWFYEKYPLVSKAVMKNSNKLVTPFDIYATLKDLLYFSGNPKVGINIAREMSLFNEIPEDRTCKDATILPHWCTCQKKYKLFNNESIVLQSGNYVLDSINNHTSKYRHICAELQLNSITDAWYSTVNDNILKYVQISGNGIKENVILGKKTVSIKDITLTLVADPNKAEFEATVRVDEHEIFELMGEISRINKYGKESDCVHDREQKKFCYCKE